jgi:trehalose 6-phosphate phosphatase
MLPDAHSLLPRLTAARAAAGLMLAGLDFDGTLAPIVSRPDDAALPRATRPLLLELAGRGDTRVALVSGRSLADLRQRVAIDDVYYAGNHGLEIEGPGVRRVHAEAEAALPGLARVARLLAQHLGGMHGVIVEDKGLTLSVHYRMVADAREEARVRDSVHELCSGAAGLRLTEGKKVVEVRPDVDWHKGRALGFLRETLLAGHEGAPTLFIGDDRTDEDAFREVGEGGCGIVVGTPPPDTAAHASLADVTAVARFLQQLASAPGAHGHRGFGEGV